MIISVDNENFIREAKYYLKDAEEREYIAEQGYEIVRKKHSAAVRSKEFLNGTN